MERARALLIGWGNATPSQLAAYEKLYGTLGLDASSIIPDTKRGLFDPSAFGRMVRPGAEALTARPGARTVVHLFSDNGFIGWAALLDELSSTEQGRAARDAIRGVVMDSSPGLWAVRDRRDFARRFALGMTPAVARAAGLGARERIPVVTPLLGLGFLVYQALFRRSVKSLKGAAELVAREQPRCPHLCLLGEDDVLVPPRDIRAWNAKQRARGIDVEEHAFVGARHVALFPHDPRRYRGTLGTFLERVGVREARRA
ncbi:MAG: DUF829 domain-containing protein [Deltaproteobacteria bacterium]|nr:DUF829 domain-containing protein [Deltaproteobacteria bacterium]